MRKAPISLQDLRRRLYIKAKTEPTWRFWGLYVHVCKQETLREAYRLAKAKDGAPGIDGVTFAAVGLNVSWKKPFVTRRPYPATIHSLTSIRRSPSTDPDLR